MKKLYIIGLIAACGFTACKPKLDPKVATSGALNFTRYLAVGNSLTAGYADGSLYKTGQMNSYPAMLAAQFDLVGGGDFIQPLLPGENGYPNAKYVLAVKRGPCDTASSLGPILYPGALDSIGSSASVALSSPFNNTGIPGIRCIDYLIPGYAKFNPYAARMFSNLAARPIDEVMRLNPTFFSVWVGANDVLAYATSGGEEGTTAISKVSDFQAAYDTIITKLTGKGAKGVALNIPDITGIPYFTTIPAKGLTLTKRQANDLNVAYNGTLVHFNEGANYFAIQDAAGVRQLKDGELVLLTLPLDSVKCAGWGTVKPIPGKYVLTYTEIDKIRAATTDFNNIIRTTNVAHNVAVLDMYAYFKTIQSGVAYNGIFYTTSFITGSLFSLDGVHPTPRGYALIANQIIMKLNEYYEASIPMVDANKYPGIKFP